MKIILRWTVSALTLFVMLVTIAIVGSVANAVGALTFAPTADSYVQADRPNGELRDQRQMVHGGPNKHLAEQPAAVQRSGPPRGTHRLGKAAGLFGGGGNID